MVFIDIKDLWFRFPDSRDYIFESLNWKCDFAQKIGLIGINGSGKTTFLRLLSGIYSPSKGNIFINAKKVKNIKSVLGTIGFVPENAKLFLQGPTVKEDLFRITNNYDRVHSIVREYNLEKVTNRKIYQLSEGQRRIIAIIISFLLPVKILLYDEPSIGLDTEGRDIFYSLAKEAAETGKLIIVSTNDTRLLPNMDKILYINESKRLIEGKTQDILYRIENISKGRIIPNQTVRLIMKLRESGYSFPYCTTFEEMNEKLANWET